MPAEPATTPCPADDVLGALAHQVLDPVEAARITSHLDNCVSCQQLMIAAVRCGVAVSRLSGPGEAGNFVSATATTRPSPSHGDDMLPHAPSTTRLGRYEIRGLLGVGGMGAVYDAHDTELGRDVALKVLRPELVSDMADRLVHESRLMARIAHPSVIAVYDVGHEGSSVFIAMELVRGSTLAAWLATHELDWRAIVALFERAGQGLAAAHSAGIVHRDFKPENVLVARDADKVVVTDFGIAREACAVSALELAAVALPTSAGLQMTTDGAVIGTPAYMAPEQIAGRAVDLRADVFAFCVSLWAALFGQRPFPGSSVVEIYATMHQPLARPPAGATRIPRRLLRALRKGLALEPCDRWPDMPSLLAELATIRHARRRIALAGAGAGAIAAAGLAIAALVASRPEPVDPCQRALAQLDEAYSPALEAQVRDQLAADPKLQGSVMNRLATLAEVLRVTHLATCQAGREVIQEPKVTACLDARRLELAGTVDDLIANGPGGASYAGRLSQLPVLASACAAPAPGLLFARIPADRALRRQVTALRARIVTARDTSDVARAIELATPLVSEAKVWPPLVAEAQLALGGILRRTDDIKPAIAMLLEAASSAARTHHDDAAIRIWTQLVQAALFDAGDPLHAVDYASNGEAALDRLGRPPFQAMLLEYAKGLALLGVNRKAEAEIALRESLRIAELTGAYALSISLQAMATLYTFQGHYDEAAATYRKAIDLRETANPSAPGWQPPDFELYADSLGRLGQAVEAERWGRRAVELADRTLPEGHRVRQNAHASQAMRLLDTGRTRDALTEMNRVIALQERTAGKRSERYGESLSRRGEILLYLGRYAAAERALARACDVTAFTLGGEDTREFAECETMHAEALSGMGRHADALPRLDRTVVALVTWYDASHPVVANALAVRGAAHAALHHRAAAVADLERAIAILTDQPSDPGCLASARWQLGKVLWPDQEPQARAEIEAALTLFKSANGRWARQRGQAAAWLDAHTRGRRENLR